MLLRFFSLFLFPFVLYANELMEPHIVSLVLNEEPKTSYFHCYTDEDDHIWMSREELDALGFPALSREPFTYHNQLLYPLEAYENLSAKLNKENLTLILYTPSEWGQANELTALPLYNGKIRPDDPGFFLIMI